MHLLFDLLLKILFNYEALNGMSNLFAIVKPNEKKAYNDWLFNIRRF